MAATRIEKNLDMSFLVKLIESGDTARLALVSRTLQDFYGEEFVQQLLDGAFGTYSVRKTISGLTGEKRND